MGCGCSSNCNCSTAVGRRGLQGAAGAAGAAGSNGQYGGFSSRWLFDTVTSSNPSSTFLRLNNSNPASTTVIYANETNADSTNVAAFLASFTNGGDYGRVRIFKEFNSAVFADFIVTNVVDSGSYQTITVTYVLSSGSFAANDSVVMSFAANGADGTNGINGIAVIDSLNYSIGTKIVSDVNTFSGVTVPIPSPWMRDNKDMLEFEVVLVMQSNSSLPLAMVGVGIDTTAISPMNHPIARAITVGISGTRENLSLVRMVGRVTRISDTLVRCHQTTNQTDFKTTNSSDLQSAFALPQTAGGTAASISSCTVSSTINDITVPSLAAGVEIFPVAGSNVGILSFSLLTFNVWGAKKI